MSAYAAFIKEIRMGFVNANKVYRKSGGSPTIAFAESISKPMSSTNTVTIYPLLQVHLSHGNAGTGQAGMPVRGLVEKQDFLRNAFLR
jgi:hypothetical protein